MKLSKDQYDLLFQHLITQKVVENEIVPNNSVVYDYDTYVSDEKLRSIFEIGGGGNKKSWKKKQRKTTKRTKSRKQRKTTKRTMQSKRNVKHV